ncbi:DUF721 domain-containing protein [Bacteroidota bacterium]
MPDNIKSISDIIGSEKAFESVRRTAENFSVIDKFDEIFPDLKVVVKAVKVDKNILFLRVENSVWRSELNFRKNLLVEKINKYFAKKVIKSIKFIS